MPTRPEPATPPQEPNRPIPAYTPEPGRAAGSAAPAMPLARVTARALAPLVRPGRLGDLYLARGYRRVAEGRAARAVRFEIGERLLGDALAVEINPCRLERELVGSVVDGGRPVRLSHWFLDGADWSGVLRPLRPSEVQVEIDAVFDHADRLEGSPAFLALVANSEAGRPAMRNRVSLTGPELIRAYLQQYVALRRSVERHGFRRRGELPAAATRPFAGAALRGPSAERGEREIGLAVAADGALLRIGGGRHRTAIAQRLKLPRIPAEVRLVHAAWLGGWIERTGSSSREALVAGLRSLSG